MSNNLLGILNSRLLKAICWVVVTIAFFYFGGFTIYGLQFQKIRAQQNEIYEKIDDLRFQQIRKRHFHKGSFSVVYNCPENPYFYRNGKRCAFK